MNKRFNTQAQGGFTLIELIVVIVILGILAATALPKFANLGGDARFASVNAAKGALSSAVAIVHGKILVNPGAVSTTGTGADAVTTLSLEGVSVSVANGYPTAATTGVIAAAGLDTTNDYAFYNATGTNIPAVPTNGFVLVPKSIDGTTSAPKCFVSYTPATVNATTNVVTAPVVSVTGSAKDCE